MNKKISILLLSLILVTLTIPLVSAQGTGSFSGLENILIGVANFAGNTQNMDASGIVGLDRFWAWFVAFGVTAALFVGVAKQMPGLKRHTGGAIFVGLAMGVLGAKASPLSGLLWDLGGIFVMIAVIASVIFMMLSVWRSGSVTSKKIGAESLGAKKDILEQQKALHEVRADEEKSERDLRLERDAMEHEKSALKNAETLAKKEFKFEKDIISKLEQMKKLIKSVEGAGPAGSQASINARQRVLNMVRAELPTMRKETGLMKKLEELTNLLRRFEYAEFRDCADESSLQQRIKEIMARHPGEFAGVDDNKVNALAAQIHKLQQQKMDIRNQLANLERTIDSENAKFNGLIAGMIESLEKGRITDSLSLIQQALMMAEDEKKIFLQIEADLAYIQKMEAKMFKLLQISMSLNEKNMNVLFKK